MVAGASHINAVMLVVAADEGVSVQTREHFDILRLLGIERGLVALTKSDLVDRSRTDQAEREVRDFVQGSFLESAPIVPVSAVTGEGLGELKSALAEIGRQVGVPEDSGVFRMPIDRVFSVHGFGTVIAGTVLSGEIKTGDRVEIFPDGITAKVRGIQVHKEKREVSGIGNRTALNLQDIGKDLLRRGQVAAAPRSLSPSLRMDARLRLLAGSKEVRTRERLRLHVGTDEVIARVVLLEEERLRPGESALVQFVLESPGVAVCRDRFIVRTFSPVVTIGGGEILDPKAERHKRFEAAAIEGLKHLEGPLEAQVEQAFRRSPKISLTAADIGLFLDKKVEVVQGAIGALVETGNLVRIGPAKEERFVPADRMAGLKEKTLAVLKQYFQANPHRPAMPAADLRSQLEKEADEPSIRSAIEELTARKAVVTAGSGVAWPGQEAGLRPRDQELADRIEAIYRKAGFEPPLEEEIIRQLRLPLNDFRRVLGILFKEGRLVRLDPRIVYHRESFERAKSLLLDFLRLRREITIADAKDVLRVSRKFACAVLEHLDGIRVTRRQGDAHVLR
jgi:selenocysteine-specific elongation factor